MKGRTYYIEILEHKEDINWNQIQKASIDHYKWTDAQAREAYGQLIYVKDQGFVAKLSCKEEDPLARYAMDGDPVYEDSALELFLQLGPEGYINCETNSEGVRLQEFGTGRSDRRNILDRGFPVTAGKEGEFWYVIIELPLKQLREFYPDLVKEELVDGRSFSGNFHKICEKPQDEPAHFGTWSEVMSDHPDFHLPEYFGTLTLRSYHRKKSIPVLNSMEKVRDTRYLKNYTLNYTNGVGKEKIYEIVSNHDHETADDIGMRASGVIIIGYKEDKLLLCKEFRMGVNAFIYNLPAGHIDPGESVEDCARRELYEETGLHITRILDVLSPSYAAPDISDSSAWVIMAEVDGQLGDHSDANEWIEAGFFEKDRVRRMLKEQRFSGRAQLAAWYFVHGK